MTISDVNGRMVTEVDAVDYNGVATSENATVATYEIDKANISEMNRTQYSYDQFDRVTNVTRNYFDIVTQEWIAAEVATNEYDKIGNLVATTDANGNTFGYEYDVFGNCTKYIEPSKYGTEGAFTTFYEYDSYFGIGGYKPRLSNDQTKFNEIRKYYGHYYREPRGMLTYYNGEYKPFGYFPNTQITAA